MNTKAEQPKGTNAADIGKLVLAVLVLAAGIFAYSWFGRDGNISSSVRLLGVLGDVWILGKHRIVCGDSTDADCVAKALNGVTPHLMVTDPPYGVNYDPTWRHSAGINNSSRQGKVKNDDNAPRSGGRDGCAYG